MTEDETATEAPVAPPRLTEDDLYEWSRLITEVQFAQRALDRFGRLALARRGLDPARTSLTNEGYITVRRSVEDYLTPEPSRNGAD